MSLEEAAQKVKISKKSLDDYLMQLRSAKKFGFNFDGHNNDKVGVIRSFVRRKKEEERKRIAKPNQVVATPIQMKSKPSLISSKQVISKQAALVAKDGVRTRKAAAVEERPVRKCRK